MGSELSPVLQKTRSIAAAVVPTMAIVLPALMFRILLDTCDCKGLMLLYVQLSAASLQACGLQDRIWTDIRLGPC